MSQLSGFDDCKALLSTQRDLVEELAIEIRRLFSNQQISRVISSIETSPLAALSAPPQTSPPAQKPCTQTTTPELPPQPIPAPVPTPARYFPPSPSVETIEEVEEKQVYKIPLRNVKQMRQKLRAQKMPTSETPSFEKCIGWSPKFGGIDMRFSRDKDPDAWYTTMLNHKQKIGALPSPA